MDKEKISLKKLKNEPLTGSVNISASKSESNRLLLINALATKPLELKNLSAARDTQTMTSLLQSQPEIWDVKDAGTTMRFLTAYLAIEGQNAVITGTDRMKERPIGPLVDSLRKLGASINYLEKDGYPPMRISKLSEQAVAKIQIPGNISSQYISALLMIAPCLPNGLELELTTEIFSRPYIDMTLKLMALYGVNHEWEGQKIKIAPQDYQATTEEYFVESDWSGASYWYSFMALNPNGGELFLPYLRKDSTQGDQAIAQIMDKMGLATSYEEGGVRLKQKPETQQELTLDFKKCPDLGQTVFVVAAVKGIKLTMTGLESLKIKETDRIQAMQNELAKIGASLTENGNSWTLEPSTDLPDQVEIETYEDHRMAMAFAPLSCLMDVTIHDPSVVKKSYPNFWEEVDKLR
jgi:3-phosphoshikimate 1-carboxyvinyltransferase